MWVGQVGAALVRAVPGIVEADKFVSLAKGEHGFSHAVTFGFSKRVVIAPLIL